MVTKVPLTTEDFEAIRKFDSNLPVFQKKSFHCPHCGVLSQQLWLFNSYHNHGGSSSSYDLWISRCFNCNEECLWVNEKMILPDSSNAPHPNGDLSDDIIKDYNEAASIMQRSPRAAAALLRLALEKLCKELGSTEKNLYAHITFLAEKRGLGSEVEEAMDSLRIAGNEAVHPGTIGLYEDDEDDKNVEMMFELINFIARELITEPKRRKGFYAKMQNSKKQEDTPE